MRRGSGGRGRGTVYLTYADSNSCWQYGGAANLAVLPDRCPVAYGVCTATSTLAPPTNASSAFHTAGPVCLERLRVPRRVVDRRRCGLPTSGENGLQHVDPGV